MEIKIVLMGLRVQYGGDHFRFCRLSSIVEHPRPEHTSMRVKNKITFWVQKVWKVLFCHDTNCSSIDFFGNRLLKYQFTFRYWKYFLK